MCIEKEKSGRLPSRKISTKGGASLLKINKVLKEGKGICVPRGGQLPLQAKKEEGLEERIKRIYYAKRQSRGERT